MRRSAGLMALLAVVFLAQPARADQTVTVASFSFTPGQVTASLGETITFDNTSLTGHTSTSDDGFWNTGTIAAGTSRDVDLVSAGTFPYHCAIHTIMQGVIAVPVQVSPAGPVHTGTKLTVAFAARDVGGRTYVVQRKIGAKPWTAMNVKEGSVSVTLKAKKAGTYRFRAALVANGVTSAFSPVAMVKVKP